VTFQKFELITSSGCFCWREDDYKKRGNYLGTELKRGTKVTVQTQWEIHWWGRGGGTGGGGRKQKKITIQKFEIITRIVLGPDDGQGTKGGVPSGTFRSKRGKRELQN